MTQNQPGQPGASVTREYVEGRTGIFVDTEDAELIELCAEVVAAFLRSRQALQATGWYGAAGVRVYEYASKGPDIKPLVEPEEPRKKRA